MKIKLTRPFSGLKPDNWRNLLFFAIFCAYFILFCSFLPGGARRSDYELYWLTGKIANEKGYSQIYSFSELSNVYRQTMVESGDYANNEALLTNKFPAPYFSLFFVPFQFLSRISVASSFKLWTFLNLAILIGYLLFFSQRIDFGISTNLLKLKLLIPFLISFPVFLNLVNGQIEVFVLICAGEFVRQAVNKKPILSGLWLGGLLIKPQLLILIIPIFIIMRYWKALLGFFASSGMILIISFLLSGLTGMLALINLWTEYATEIPNSALQTMINWRMVGVSINNLLNTSFGWSITSLGMILTFLAVFFLIKQIPSYGTSLWVIKMMGIFAATLAITWHSLSHMAMVLIPFLVYALVNKLLPERWILFWGIASSVAYIGTLIVELIFVVILRINPINLQVLIVAFFGMISNLIILFIIIQNPDNVKMSRINLLSINNKS